MSGLRNWSRTALNTAVGAVVGAALLGGAGAAWAQQPQPAGTVLVLPPGAVLVIAQNRPAAEWAQAVMLPDPVALMQQADQMIADAQRAFGGPAWSGPDRMMEAALRQLRQSGGAISGVVVSSFSDSHGSCTRTVRYSSDGRSPVTHVSMTGNACAPAGLPTATPELREPERQRPGSGPEHPVPRTWRVDTTAPRPQLQLASLGR